MEVILKLVEFLFRLFSNSKEREHSKNSDIRYLDDRIKKSKKRYQEEYKKLVKKDMDLYNEKRRQLKVLREESDRRLRDTYAKYASDTDRIIDRLEFVIKGK